VSLADLVRPGHRVALADGVGCPVSVLPELSRAAAQAGDVDLLLCWATEPLAGLDLASFVRVRTFMAGFGLRADVDAGRVGYIPTRLSVVPALLRGPLRPDVVVASVVATPSGWVLGTEVGWVRAAVDAGARVAGVERSAVPGLDVGPPLPAEQLTLVGSSSEPPLPYAWATPSPVDREIAARVAALIPAGARVQHAPGPLGTAVIDALEVPVGLDTGIITEAAMGLERRGLLLGRALTPWVAGTPDLYEWCVGNVDVDRLERTHDPVRLGKGSPFVAVNTALEVDHDGQVNVEAAGGSAVAGIGGQPDYALGAARSAGGLSVVAVPTRRGEHRTLVERLSGPASTPSHDIDVIVTEHGTADLRGLDRAERRRRIDHLWGAA